MYNNNLMKYRDNSEARKLITTCGEYEDQGGQLEKRSVSTSKMMDDRCIWENLHDAGGTGRKANSRNILNAHFSDIGTKRPLELEPISRNGTYATSALDYRRQQRDYPGISNPQTLHQLEGQIEHEKNIRKIHGYFHGKIK